MNVATMEKQQEDNSQMGMVLQVAATDQCSSLNPHDWFFSDTTETGRSHTSALWWQHVHMGNSETDLHVWYQDEIHISNVRLHAGASPGILLVHNNVCPLLARMKAVPGWWRHWRQLWRYEDSQENYALVHRNPPNSATHCPEVYWCLDPSPEQDLKTSAKSACRVMGTTHTAEPHYDAGQTSLFLTWIFGVVSKFKPLKGGWYWFSLLVDHFVLKIITKFMTLKIFRVSISFIKIQCVI